MALLFAPRLWSNSDSISDLLQRFDNYGDRLTKISVGGQRLTVLGVSETMINNQKLLPYNNINLVLFKKNFVGRIRVLYHLFTLLPKEKVLIAGDPFMAFWILYFSNLALSRKARIQISIHGLPLEKAKWSINNLKFLSIRSSCLRADSIRVVSDHLADFLQKSWKISTEKIFTAPIPVTIPILVNTKYRKKEILIVGRLHEERGIFLSFQIALKVLAEEDEVHLTVIGDGPLKERLKERIRNSDFTNRISLVGHVSHSEVLASMSLSRVLLSCAPEEGFGLAIREAVFSGLTVVAFRNEGTLQAEMELAPNLKVIETIDEGYLACLQAIKSNYDSFYLENIRIRGNKLNDLYLDKIAKSWI